MDFATFNVGSVIAVISVVLSFGAIFVSLRTAREQQHLSRHLAEEEHLLLFEQVRMQRDSDVIRWTKDCVFVLAACEAFVDFSATQGWQAGQNEQYQNLCVRLSALIDEGRMFFPNQEPESKGAKKPGAYRGQRQLILTVLVRIYDLFKKGEGWEDAVNRKAALKSLNDLRRLFVSESQVAIDPRRYIALKEMNEFKRRKGVQEQSLTCEETL